MSEPDPHISLVGLRIFVHGYEYSDSSDGDDNWLRVTTTCIGQKSRVEVFGSILRADELLAWLRSCEALVDGKAKEASLNCLEPYLDVQIDHSGEFARLVATVRLRADYLNETHEWRFPIDPSYVTTLKQDLKRTLAEFPVRGSR